jgi:uracil-xanthine permease
VIGPEERLPWGQTLVVGLQHVFAMFGATVLVPILMGFDPNTSVFFSGIGTLLFFVVVGGRVPSYLGSSFAFVAITLTATGYGGSGPNPNIGVALGGIIAAGALYAIIGVIVMGTGYRWIERLMPPVVTGAVVAVIGLNLAPVAVKAISGSGFDTTIGLLTVLATGAVAVYAPGLLRRVPILLGGIIGYLLYLVLANGMGMGPAINFAPLREAAWIGFPNFSRPVFRWDVALLFAPAALVLVAENLGHVKAVGAMTGQSLDRYLGRAFVGDGLACMLAASGGGTGVTTYAENIGVMAVTRIYSTLIFVVAGVDHPGPGAGRAVGGALRADRGHRRADLGAEPGGFLQQPQPGDGRGHADHRGGRPGAEDRRLYAPRHRHGDVRRDHPLPAAARAGGAPRRLGHRGLRGGSGGSAGGRGPLIPHPENIASRRDAEAQREETNSPPCLFCLADRV